MTSMIKHYYWILFVVLPCLMGLETCGINTFFGGQEGDYAPTEPCTERIPSPTPLPIVLTPPPGPLPKGTPIIIAGVTPTPNSVPTLSLAPTPTATMLPSVYVNNTVPCTFGVPCGIPPGNPCCGFQDGIDTAYDEGLNRVYAVAGSYTNVTSLSPFSVYGNHDLTIEASSPAVMLTTVSGYSILFITSPATNIIRNFTIVGDGYTSAVVVNAPGGQVSFQNNTFNGGIGGGSYGVCLSLANGTVTLNNNAFNYTPAGLDGGTTIECSGGLLLSNGNNTQNIDGLGRHTAACNAPAVACNPLNPPAYSCSSPPTF